MVSGARKFELDAVSHTIFLVKRVDVSGRTGWSRSSVEPITKTVELKFRKALRSQLVKATGDEQIDLYHFLVNVEGTRRIAGIVLQLFA